MTDLLLYACSIILLCVMISGCAYHTQKTDFEVEQFGQSWMNQPFEQFIAYHPDVSNPLPIGNGSIRYVYCPRKFGPLPKLRLCYNTI